MYKKLLTVLIMVFSLGFYSSAQVNTSSPYSRFGIGDINNQVIGSASGMGGIAAGLRLPYDINPINPASYTAVPKQVFLFQVGMKTKRVDYSYQNETFSNYEFSFESINAAFRVNKFWAMSVGLNPLSSIGYEIDATDSITYDNKTTTIDNQYVGEGGLNKLYLGNSLKYKGLSIGFNASYIFGPIIKQRNSALKDDDFQSHIIDIETSKIRDFHFRYGVQYSDSIFNKYYFVVGGFFENKANLNGYSSKYTTRTILNESDIAIQDTIVNDTLISGSIEMPLAFGAGFSLTSKKLIIGMDYKMSNWKDVSFFNQKFDYLANSYEISAGAEFTNDYMSKKYFNTVNFRLGGKYSKMNLILNDTQLSDYAVTFGLGFPTKAGAKINLGFVVGQRGTIENDLIKENYYLINLNLNFMDRWFVKRKFF